jgi:hypothetical protein
MVQLFQMFCGLKPFESTRWEVNDGGNLIGFVGWRRHTPRGIQSEAVVKNKATHRGHCQVCNRVQKLPNGLLAKHGYAVLGGYFEGTCYGSGHSPLELDKTMVIKSIEFTHKRIQEFNDAVLRWSVPATEPEAWFHEYNQYFGKYIWRRVPLQREVKPFENGHSFNIDTFTDSDGKKQPLQRYSISGPTLLNIADQMNRKYIDNYLWKGIKDMTQYIKDQRHRIATWHKQPLMPLEEN